MSKAGIMSYVGKASYGIKSRLSRMALLAAFCLGGGTVVCGQELPDEVTVNIGPVRNVGEDVTLVLQKRSVRSENYALFINENGTRRRAKPFPVTTYRGHVDGDPSMRVNGNIEPGNLLSANFSMGRDIIGHVTRLEIGFKPGKSTPFSSSGNKVVPISSLTPRVSPTKGGYVVPPLPMRLVRMKLNVAPDLFANSKISVETAVSRAEQKMNDADFNWARNVATAWEIEELEIGSPEPVRGVKWYTPAEGEPDWQSRAAFGATFCAGGNGIRGGHPFVAGLGQEAGGFMHEAGHAFGCPHGLDKRDAMHGNRAWFGPNNTRVITRNWERRSEDRFPAVIYNGYLPPQAQDDIAETHKDEQVTIDVMDNDFDGNGQSLHLVGVEMETTKGGKAEVTDDRMYVIYTPPTGFIGRDTFRYEVANEDGVSSRAGIVDVNVITEGVAAYFDFEHFEQVQPQGHGSRGYQYPNKGPVGGPARIYFFEPKQVQGVDGAAMFNTINAGWGASRTPAHYMQQVNIAGIGDPGPGNLSVSLWILYPKLRKNMQVPGKKHLSSTSGVIIGKGAIKYSGNPNPPYSSGWNIIHLPKYKGFKFVGSTGDASFDLQSMEPIEVNRWYHLVMVMDRRAGRLRAYVNNQRLHMTTSTSRIGSGDIADAQELRLYNSDTWQYWHAFPAVFDELKIFYTALTEDQIAALYAEGEGAGGLYLEELLEGERPDEPVFDEDGRFRARTPISEEEADAAAEAAAANADGVEG